MILSNHDTNCAQARLLQELEQQIVEVEFVLSGVVVVAGKCRHARWRTALPGKLRQDDPPSRARLAATPRQMARRVLAHLPGAAGSGLLHLDFQAHPGMNAALKFMLAFRQTRNLQLAALKDSRPCDRDV